jgi:hypothetical protein
MLLRPDSFCQMPFVKLLSTDLHIGRRARLLTRLHNQRWGAPPFAYFAKGGRQTDRTNDKPTLYFPAEVAHPPKNKYEIFR